MRHAAYPTNPIRRGRRILTVLAAAVLALGVARPAAATTSITDLGQLAGIGASTFGGDCNTGGPAKSAATRALLVKGPGMPTLGTGSLALTNGVGDDFAGFEKTFDSLAAITRLSLGVQDPDGTTLVEIALSYDGGMSYWFLAVGLAPRTSWQTVDLTNATWTWFPPGYDGSTTPDQGTIAQFVAAHGTAPGAVDVFRAPCFFGDTTTTGTTFIDAFTLTSGGADNPLDFEGTAPPPGTSARLTIGASRSSLTAGQAVTLTTHETVGGAAATSGNVDLYAKASGASSYTKVGSATVNGNGNASLTVRPKKTTVYQWRAGGATSPTRTVGVRTALTITIADTTLHKGQQLVVTGRTVPAKPGFTVTLHRRTASGTSVLGTGVVTTTGSFKITKTLKSAGTYKVYATIPAGGGNLAGTSVTRSATVS